MDNNNTNKIYNFLNFQVNPQQRTVTKDSRPINLSKKSFDMLVVLLQRHGELIIKDELLAAVWPNQIITDYALSKQISRLKKALEPSDSPISIIETVRGVGFRLLGDVQEGSVDILATKPKKSYLLLGVTAVVIALTLITYYLYQQKTATSVQITDKTLAPKNTKPINIAIIPAEKTDDWLDIGGLNYLTELIQQDSDVGTISPQKNWFDSTDNHLLAAQLLSVDNIDYTLSIKNIVLDGVFKSKLVLRNKKGVLINGDIQAESLSLLFDNIRTWVNQQTRIGSELKSYTTKYSKISNYALESYLRGLTVGEDGKYTQAIEFMKTAVDQDKDFFPAWIMLVKLEAELGNYEKSIAIADTIERLDGFDENLLNHLYNAKAKSLIYLNKLDEADAILKKSIALSELNQDMKAKITSLGNQVMVHDRRGKINDESLKILLLQLDLAKQHDPLLTILARLNYNLSVINTELDNPKKAREYIDKAILQYKQSTDNAIGLFASYAVLSYQHYELAQNDKALLILAEAEKLIDEIESPSVIAYFYMNKARSQSGQGYRTQSINTLEKLTLLSAKIGAKQPKVFGYRALIEQQIAYNDFDAAQLSIKEFITYVSETPEDYLASVGYLATFDMYISARFDDPVLARNKMNQYLQTHPEMKEYLADELKRIEAHILAKEGFIIRAARDLHSLMNYYINKGRVMKGLQVAYEVLELQWLNDMDGFEKTLIQVNEIAVFEYPIVKFRAQLLAFKKDYINAVMLMQDLKPKAREFWSIEDQLLLEKYQQKASIKPLP
ncbi:MAG: winged helix-turn-helix domain-containing protein [Proteobacteria bacterium]|nr:winged helix-turn-helix domain-containing protein [Pseudomonadota bacterium]